MMQGAIKDWRTVEQRMASADAAISRAAQEDVIIDGPRRLLLRSPNGTYFRIDVSNAGVISATNVGTTLP